RSKFVDEIDRWLNARELLLKPPKNDRKDGVGGWGARYHDISVDSAARDTACHRFFLEIKAHLERCADLEKPEQRFAKAFIAHELALRMKAYDPALLQPDDVIQLINDKLGDRHTEAALRRMVTNQYPVCMVDEFQDTDPEQFRL